MAISSESSYSSDYEKIRNLCTPRLTEYVQHLIKHPFWPQIHILPKNADDHMSMAMIACLCLDAFQDGSSLHADRLEVLVTSDIQGKASLHLLTQVQQKLDEAMVVFAGAQLRHWTDVIIISLTVGFLREQGFDLFYSKSGCLVSWLTQQNYSGRLSRLKNKNGQDDLLQKNREALLTMSGLVKRSSIEMLITSHLLHQGDDDIPNIQGIIKG